MIMTQPRRMVLATMLTDPEAEWYGYDLARRTGLESGTVSPMLTGLATAQTPPFLLVRDEPAEQAREQGRPARRLYRLNPEMVDAVRQLVGDGLPLSLGSEFRRAMAVGDGEKTPEQADRERFDEGMQMLRRHALEAVPLLFVHLSPAERRDLARRLAASVGSVRELCGDEWQPEHVAGSHPEDCRSCSVFNCPLWSDHQMR